MKKQLLVIAMALLSNAAHADDLIDPLIQAYGKDNTAVLDLAGQQVVCGYSDVNSEINREQYADKVCQHFGYAASVGHICGMSGDQDESQAKVLTVDPVTGNPIELPFVKEPGRSLGFYSLMICVKEIPPQWRQK